MKNYITLALVISLVVATAGASEINDEWFKQVEANYASRVAQLAAKHEGDVATFLDTLKKGAWTAEAFAVRDYLRQFSATKELAPTDVVQTPKELRNLQLKFLSGKQKAADEVIGDAQQKIDVDAAELTKKGDLDAASSLQNKIEQLKARLGYAGKGLLKGNASTLPSEITITDKLSLQVNLLGQTTLGLELNPGESYKTRGVTGDNIVIQVGSDAVTIPIANTDLSARVAAAKKGITYSADSTQNPATPATDSTAFGQTTGNSLSFNPAAWKSVRPLPRADVNFFADRVDFHSRGTIVSVADYSAATVELVGEFKSSSDVLDVYLRATERRTNPFGAPDSGIAIHVDMPTGSLSAFTWDYTSDGRQDLATAPLGISVGQRFYLRVVDDGSNIRVYLDNASKPKLLFKTNRSFGKKVIIHNREAGHLFTAWSLKISGR